ncbi:hypothetical protein LTR08_002766 [Meristemomyces frigidus]|nr:hypothetical protein LTR08_002766 [Meristemomyces frigidus]
MTASKGRRERKLPIQQLSILAICRFTEPIASTSLFPYLPEMIKSFGIPQSDVGKWAGLTTAVFSISQACMGIPWGRFSDIYGRKPAILLGEAFAMITTLMWGFSLSLPMAITARALAGAGNGNVGIIRTTVAEMVPFKELQPRAFSLMPLVWNIGSIFGPTIGGALANPFNVEPGETIANPSFLERFPYALPNIVAACIFTIGITTGILFLEETLETLQDQRDYGLRLGDKLKGLVKSHVMKMKDILHFRKSKSAKSETEPLLKSSDNEESGLPIQARSPRPPPPSFREVMTRQSILNLVVYALLAMHTMASDQLLPVYMQYPSVWSDSPYATPPDASGNPLKFAGGFGLDHFRIGLISTCYGVCGMLVQFFIFPPVARRLGILYCLKWCACLFPITYLLMPFAALMPTQETQVAACFAVMLFRCFCGIFAYPCSTILLTNSASSLRVLGTLNGVGTSVAAVGRAIGPALGGSIFTMGVKKGYVVAPWWTFSAIAVVAAIPVFWLVEGEGFGGDDEVSDGEEEAEITEAEGLGNQADGTGAPGSAVLGTTQQVAEEEEEEAYGEVGALLNRTNTASSTALTEDGTPSGTPSASRRTSQDRRASHTGSRHTMRRMSMPIGMGSQGISRRYSSNLGQSFGSAAGN